MGSLALGVLIYRRLLGETIPIRLFLGGFELAPTFRGKIYNSFFVSEPTVVNDTVFFIVDVNKKFSTRYYLNLVLIDEENRRYFKQQEITMFRRKSKHMQIHELTWRLIFCYQSTMATLQTTNRLKMLKWNTSLDIAPSCITSLQMIIYCHPTQASHFSTLHQNNIYGSLVLLRSKTAVCR